MSANRDIDYKFIIYIYILETLFISEYYVDLNLFNMCVKSYRSMFVLYSCVNLSFNGWKHPSAAGGLISRSHKLT